MVYPAPVQTTLPKHPYTPEEIHARLERMFHTVNDVVYLRLPRSFKLTSEQPTARERDAEMTPEWVLEHGADMGDLVGPWLLAIPVDALGDPHEEKKIRHRIAQACRALAKTLDADAPNLRTMLEQTAARPEALMKRLHENLDHYRQRTRLTHITPNSLKRLGEECYTLPPWTQVALLESGTTIMDAQSRAFGLAGQDEVHDLPLQHASVNAEGIFNARSHRIGTDMVGRLPVICLSHPLSHQRWMDNFLHEIGHLEDHLAHGEIPLPAAPYPDWSVIRPYNVKADLASYASNQEEWKDCVAQWWEHATQRRSVLDGKILSHCRRYEEDERPAEAMAELKRVVTLCYRQHEAADPGHGLEATDRELSRELSPLWDHYRDHQLPKIIAWAENAHALSRTHPASAAAAPAVSGQQWQRAALVRRLLMQDKSSDLNLG